MHHHECICVCTMHSSRTIIWRIILRIYTTYAIALYCTYVILDKIPPFSQIFCSHFSYACALHQHGLLHSPKKTELLYELYCSSYHPCRDDLWCSIYNALAFYFERWVIILSMKNEYKCKLRYLSIPEAAMKINEGWNL